MGWTSLIVIYRGEYPKQRPVDRLRFGRIPPPVQINVQIGYLEPLDIWMTLCHMPLGRAQGVPGGGGFNTSSTGMAAPIN